MYSLKRVVKGVAWLCVGGTQRRRRVLQELARISAGAFGGFEISEDYKRWQQDSDFMRAYRRLSPGNPYSAERKFFLREMARLTREVPGSVAECGCYEGASAYFLASTLPHATLHLFDSFAGLPEPTARDHTQEWMWQKGDLTASEATTRANLAEFPNVVIHRGWIPETFTSVANERFRLAHIDVDLYEPTLASLEFLYPRLNSGGVIVLDDYGFTNCEGAYRAVEEYMRSRPEPIIHCPTGQAIIFKR